MCELVQKCSNTLRSGLPCMNALVSPMEDSGLLASSCGHRWPMTCWLRKLQCLPPDWRTMWGCHRHRRHQSRSTRSSPRGFFPSSYRILACSDHNSLPQHFSVKKKKKISCWGRCIQTDRKIGQARGVGKESAPKQAIHTQLNKYSKNVGNLRPWGFMSVSLWQLAWFCHREQVEDVRAWSVHWNKLVLFWFFLLRRGLTVQPG